MPDFCLETVTLDQASDRYRKGEYRATIFRDLILSEMRARGDAATVLDIGCGGGFDDNMQLQQSLATEAETYVGIEPDSNVTLGDWIAEEYRTVAEDADVPSSSIDVALAVMVLEHVEHPGIFFEKIYELLKSGGVFWGFTMDRRHPFCTVSTVLERLRLKETYLHCLRGRRGMERYNNYRTYYRANSPQQITRSTQQFAQRQFASLARIGQLDYYVPRLLRFLPQTIDRLGMMLRLPGSLLVVRLEK